VAGAVTPQKLAFAINDILGTMADWSEIEISVVDQSYRHCIMKIKTRPELIEYDKDRIRDRVVELIPASARVDVHFV
jgi:hypothetical protein